MLHVTFLVLITVKMRRTAAQMSQSQICYCQNTTSLKWIKCHTVYIAKWQTMKCTIPLTVCKVQYPSLFLRPWLFCQMAQSWVFGSPENNGRSHYVMYWYPHACYWNEVFCRVLLKSLLHVVLIEVVLLILSVVPLCRNRIGGLSRRERQRCQIETFGEESEVWATAVDD